MILNGVKAYQNYSVGIMKIEGNLIRLLLVT